MACAEYPVPEREQFEGRSPKHYSKMRHMAKGRRTADARGGVGETEKTAGPLAANGPGGADLFLVMPPSALVSPIGP